MPFGIDVKGMTAKLDERFASMMAELQMIREALDAILAELRTSRGAPQ